MIVIIDYGLGNLGSVKNTLDKLGILSVISDSKADIENSSGIILPGVGSASEGMNNLKKKNLDKIIIKEVLKRKPFLGICLGMQLLFSYSEEGNTSCLNIIGGVVKKFAPRFKIPQIGWNEIRIENRVGRRENLFKQIPDNSSFYFVNSYYCVPDDKSLIVGKTEYGIEFCSILCKKNVVATQFHPEKSGENGLQLLKNFINMAYANNPSN